VRARAHAARPHVAVVGGGLAGIAAALECADAGARVTLLESRRGLGGATWSTRRDGLWIDNGQHVFLRCFDAYRALLGRLGVADRAPLQPRLDVPVVAPGGRTHRLSRARLPAPLHLAPALLRYGHLPLRDRAGVARAARALAALDPSDPACDDESFGSWLARHGQSPAAVAGFWDLVARPTLNLPAGEASLALALVVFQRGFLRGAADCDLGMSAVPLQHLHGDPAERALAAAGARVETGQRVRALEAAGERVRVALRGGELEADAAVLAVPPDAAPSLLPAAAGLDAAGVAALGASPIVSLHVVYERRVTPLALAAGIGTPVQFVFDRSAAAGLESGSGQYLTVTLSAADAWVGASAEALRRRFLPELARLFPAACTARVRHFRVTCERAATFRQAPGTARLRPGTRTRLPRIALAGAWVDTGWPATMEGAVRSGRDAARAALEATGGHGTLPRAA